MPECIKCSGLIMHTTTRSGTDISGQPYTRNPKPLNRRPQTEFKCCQVCCAATSEDEEVVLAMRDRVLEFEVSGCGLGNSYESFLDHCILYAK